MSPIVQEGVKIGRKHLGKSQHLRCHAKVKNFYI